MPAPERGTGPDPYDDSPESEEFVKMVFDVAVEVLKELDASGTFGMGDERRALTLGIWKGDQSDEERIAFVALLNDEDVASRFAAELAASTDAFFALAGR